MTRDAYSATNPTDQQPAAEQCEATRSAVCPVCNGRTLVEIRGKLQCQRCHTICETCCEGGPP